MKCTGIIRRIDELGRIVIPKEIRKTLKIRDGDFVEILVQSEGQLVLKKFAPLSCRIDERTPYAQTLSRISNLHIVITNLDIVISASDSIKSEYISKSITSNLLEIINNRVLWISKNRDVIKIYEDDLKDKYVSQVILPITYEGCLTGCIVMFSKEGRRVINENDINLLKLAVEFLEQEN